MRDDAQVKKIYKDGGMYILTEQKRASLLNI